MSKKLNEIKEYHRKVNHYNKARALFAELNRIKPRGLRNSYTYENLNAPSVRHLVKPGDHVHLAGNRVVISKARTFKNFHNIFEKHPTESGRTLLQWGRPPKIYVYQALEAYRKPLNQQFLKYKGQYKPAKNKMVELLNTVREKRRKAMALIQNAALRHSYRPGGTRAKNAEKRFYESAATMRPKTPSPRKSPSPRKTPSPRKSPSPRK